jgi:hypothetical protein
MEIAARPAQGREVSPDSFADITAVPVSAVDWMGDGLLRVTFDGAPSAVEQQKVRLRITSCDDTDERMRVAVAAFLALDAPTNAQTLAQVKRLTRLLLSLDDG